MEYFTNNFLAAVISFLWILPAITTRGQSFPLRNYFRIFALRNLLVELLVFLEIYYQNTVYLVSELIMIAIILNPNHKIVYIRNSLRWFYVLAISLLTSHVFIFYVFEIKTLEVYNFMFLSFVQTVILLLATQQKLQYRLTLNYYTFFLLLFFFFNFLRLILHSFEFYRMSLIFNLVDLIPIVYFSIAKYDKSRPIFKFT